MTSVDQARINIINIIMNIDDIGSLEQIRNQASSLSDQSKPSLSASNEKEKRIKELMFLLNTNCVLPSEQWEQFQKLTSKRVQNDLTEVEQNELNQLIELEEQLRLERVKILGELAQLRQMDLASLMTDLDYKTYS